MLVAHIVKCVQSVSLTAFFYAFTLQLLHGWQSEQSGGLPKNSTIGHTNRTDH